MKMQPTDTTLHKWQGQIYRYTRHIDSQIKWNRFAVREENKISLVFYTLSGGSQNVACGPLGGRFPKTLSRGP